MKRYRARVQAVGWVEVEVDDDMGERFGFRHCARENAIEALDLDTAEIDVTDLEEIE